MECHNMETLVFICCIFLDSPLTADHRKGSPKSWYPVSSKFAQPVKSAAEDCAWRLPTREEAPLDLNWWPVLQKYFHLLHPGANPFLAAIYHWRDRKRIVMPRCIATAAGWVISKAYLGGLIWIVVPCSLVVTGLSARSRVLFLRYWIHLLTVYQWRLSSVIVPGILLLMVTQVLEASSFMGRWTLHFAGCYMYAPNGPVHSIHSLWKGFEQQIVWL